MNSLAERKNNSRPSATLRFYDKDTPVGEKFGNCMQPAAYDGGRRKGFLAGLDDEMLLIMAIILLLFKEKADLKIILALIYVALP